MSELKCPFCNETDFDAVGLKSHLVNYCESFKSTASIHPVFGMNKSRDGVNLDMLKALRGKICTYGRCDFMACEHVLAHMADLPR